jgi:hypothetical protein
MNDKKNETRYLVSLDPSHLFYLSYEHESNSADPNEIHFKIEGRINADRWRMVQETLRCIIVDLDKEDTP